MTTTVLPDRRQRRRLETIEEIVGVAVEVMSEQGVGGLSLGEVARRMGIRPPSLYVYFDSKAAVYDAVFTRGWRSVDDVMEPVYADVNGAADLTGFLLRAGSVYLRWTIEHPVYAQLMNWRPVPGYEPSEEAYAAAVGTLDAGLVAFARLVERGLLREGLTAERLLTAWTVLLTGVMTQQLANAPQESFEHGRFTSTLPELVSMYAVHYGRTAPSTKGRR